MHTLRALREARNLTQYDLADLAGVTQGAISQLESGQSFTGKDSLPVGGKKRALIAQAVGVEVDEIAWDGPAFKLAEAHRLIGRALAGDGRGFGLRAVRLLMTWAVETRPAGVAAETVSEGEE